MNELDALQALAGVLGVHTAYIDGLGRPVTVGAETLVRVCAALGAPVARPADAAEALRVYRAGRPREPLAPVVVAWDGRLPPVPFVASGSVEAELRLEDGSSLPIEVHGSELRVSQPLPFGYHELRVGTSAGSGTSTVIVAPVQAWRRPGSGRSWGVGSHLAALRSARSRSVGDLRDLGALCAWVGNRGGDLVTVLPLLPTFNKEPAEPSPYAPVTRLFWSELVLDLGASHQPEAAAATLDVTRADAEVRAALARIPAPSALDDELVRYASFRGAQVRLGRNWREWPAHARDGTIDPEYIDLEEQRFHLVAQTRIRKQLEDFRQRLDGGAVRLGMDLAVGVHPDGYDPWSRQPLFVEGMSVGAPPDGGFPSGQDWGFRPVLPEASRREGHRYLAAAIAHQAMLADVLRVDHIMAWTRLYWIPHGFGKHEGTYVSYPSEELFAVLTLESNRARCEIVGENLGTVPPEIVEALPRHRIRGMYVAQFQAEKDPAVTPPAATELALINAHDTPTLAGWLAGVDIDERIRCGLLTEQEASRIREERSIAARRLAERLGQSPDDPRTLLAALLDWLGRSESPLVVPWLEDLWLEKEGVNLPATRSSERPNWQRPMSRLLDEVFVDPEIETMLRRLNQARNPE